jgi:hypothetical protein
MIKLVGWLGLLVAGSLLFNGVYTLSVNERDPHKLAESSCPAPPNGVDSAERQACISQYEHMSEEDIADGSLFWGTIIGLVSTIALITSRDARGLLRVTHPGT